MKANELMIGDWVKSRTQMIVKIMGLSCDAPCEYEPIPITAEILEKNGWDGIDNYREYKILCGVFNDDYNCEIGLDKFGRCFLTFNGWEYSIYEIKGVHELQHTLRLCGLNKLADNIKI